MSQDKIVIHLEHNQGMGFSRFMSPAGRTRNKLSMPETELWDGLRHRHGAKAAGKRLLPGPTTTAPAFDPTTYVESDNLRSN
jgi:hypothetical protein